MPALTGKQAQANLSQLDGWQIEDGQLVKTFKFKSFRGSLDFVNRVGELAELAGHHPDINILYNQVRLSLISHDAGGLTAKDFDLAAKIEKAI